VIKKPDLSMMLNGAIAALVAITAACAFVAPWAAILIGFVAGVIVVVGVLAVDKIGIDDPVGAVAAHGMSGMWGTLALGFLAVPDLADKLATGRAGSSAVGSTSSASGARPAGRRRLHLRRRSSSSLADEGDRRHPHRPGQASAATCRSTA
jgi:ammonia channel protein AmtB